MFTRFFYDLTYWPSFWPRKTHIRTWPILMKISQKMWSLECSQVFSMIWPTDLVFEPGRSIFELDLVWLRLDQNCGLYDVHKVFLWFDLLTYFLTRDDPYSILTNFDLDQNCGLILSKLMKIEPKLWALECSQGFSMIWPFDLVFDQRIHIRTWLRYCQDEDSEQVWWRLDQNSGLILSKLDEDWTKTVLLECLQGFSMIWPTNLLFDPGWSPIFNLWDIVKMMMSKLDEDWTKLWPLECSQGFSMIWPTDLVFDPTSPIFALEWDVVKMIILSKIDEDWTKTVASRVFTRFFHDYFPRGGAIFDPKAIIWTILVEVH